MINQMLCYPKPMLCSPKTEALFPDSSQELQSIKLLLTKICSTFEKNSLFDVTFLIRHRLISVNGTETI